MLERERVVEDRFNQQALLPSSLRLDDFRIAMQDVYDFFFDVNEFFHERSLPRLEDTLRAAIMSGMISDMLTASIAKHSRSLTQNLYHNGHPDLLISGRHAKDACKAADEGIEIKTTRKAGGAVDTHGGRDQWMCVFVYEIDNTIQPAQNRKAMRFTEIYLARVSKEDFRRNERGELGTRTSTLDKEGVKKLRLNWVYNLHSA